MVKKSPGDTDFEIEAVNPLHSKGTSAKILSHLDTSIKGGDVIESRETQYDTDIEMGQFNPLRSERSNIEKSPTLRPSMDISGQRIRNFGNGKGASLLSRKKPEAPNKVKHKPPVLVKFLPVEGP